MNFIPRERSFEGIKYAGEFYPRARESRSSGRINLLKVEVAYPLSCASSSYATSSHDGESGSAKRKTASRRRFVNKAMPCSAHQLRKSASVWLGCILSKDL